jgi:hypothetical protein
MKRTYKAHDKYITLRAACDIAEHLWPFIPRWAFRQLVIDGHVRSWRTSQKNEYRLVVHRGQRSGKRHYLRWPEFERGVREQLMLRIHVD